MKAVIDTNVFVSAFWTNNSNSPTVRIYNAMLRGDFVPLYADDIIAEYREVLLRDKFGFDIDKVNAVIDYILEYGERVDPADSDANFPDPDDRVFYCVALAKDDEAASLITGNIRHYPTTDFVVTPSEFCAMIGI